MNPIDLTHAAALARTSDLLEAACASRLTARAACARAARTPSATSRLRSALRLDHRTACD